MKLSSRMAIIVFLLIFLVTLSLTLEACARPEGSIITISVYSRRNGIVQIYYNDVYIGKIKRNVEVSWEADGVLPQYSIIAEVGGHMEADIRGKIVYSTTFTQFDLKFRKTYRVVIPSEYD